MLKGKISRSVGNSSDVCLYKFIVVSLIEVEIFRRYGV
jgi:hypothetical protein